MRAANLRHSMKTKARHILQSALQDLRHDRGGDECLLRWHRRANHFRRNTNGADAAALCRKCLERRGEALPLPFACRKTDPQPIRHIDKTAHPNAGVTEMPEQVALFPH